MAPNGETMAQITREAVNGGREAFPVGPGLKGPSVLRVQVLLDRVLFSPGMIDGSWGKNTSVAVYWFQAREGLLPTGVVDGATFARMHFLAGRPAEYVVRRALTAADVRGPFVELPSSIYAQAQLNCTCYESLTEKLTELFHVRMELLRQLNPRVALNSLKAGDSINVPNVRDPDAPPRGTVETLVVSGADHYLQALDAAGRIIYQFPTTVGSSYDPSPEGNFHVLQVTENPWWHYQPAILHHGNEDAPEAHVPPGPNSAVGKVWMTLSTAHYGIHGTKSPETIGYAVSAGCVRLANWDALYLARRITPGTPVVFRGTRTGTGTRTVNRTPAPAARPRPAGPALAGVRADSSRAKPAADSTRRDSTRRDSAPAAPARTDSAVPPPQAQPAAPPAAPATPPPGAFRPGEARQRRAAVAPATDRLTQRRGAAEKANDLLCGSASLRETLLWCLSRVLEAGREKSRFDHSQSWLLPPCRRISARQLASTIVFISSMIAFASSACRPKRTAWETMLSRRATRPKRPHSIASLRSSRPCRGFGVRSYAGARIHPRPGAISAWLRGWSSTLEISAFSTTRRNSSSLSCRGRADHRWSSSARATYDQFARSVGLSSASSTVSALTMRCLRYPRSSSDSTHSRSNRFTSRMASSPTRSTRVSGTRMPHRAASASIAASTGALLHRSPRCGNLATQSPSSSSTTFFGRAPPSELPGPAGRRSGGGWAPRADPPPGARRRGGARRVARRD